MRTFAKFVFITNLCFLLTVAFRFVEMRRSSAVASSESLLWSPLQSSLVVLGYSSVLFSTIFGIWMIQALYRKKGLDAVPKEPHFVPSHPFLKVAENLKNTF